jgi:hypothetical protein
VVRLGHVNPKRFPSLKKFLGDDKPKGPKVTSWQEQLQTAIAWHQRLSAKPSAALTPRSRVAPLTPRSRVVRG